MRIGIDISKLAVRLDGLGRYCAGLLQGLAELERASPAERRHRYRLYDFEGSARAEQWPAWIGSLGDEFELVDRRAPEPGEVDVLHCTAHAVPETWRGALVFSLYDLTFLELPQVHTLDNRLACTVGLARCLARGGRLAAISETTRREAVRVLGVDPATIAVVPPGVDERFAPLPEIVLEATAATLGLRRPYILHVGVDEPRKNVAALVEAYRLLPAEVRQRYSLVLAGHGGWGDTGAAADPERDAPGEIRRLGPVSEGDLPALYGGASVFVFPSLYEGFGLPPLEAMACGAPVVASSSSSLPEALGDAAELCAPEAGPIAAAVGRVLADADHREALRHRGLEQARRWRWTASARLMRVLYEQVVEGV